MKTQKLGFMSRLRNRKGFSLVEIAVVLVIIGIIIGAVVKGQDLILNARAKQVTSQLNTWRNLSLAYLDRNGRLPGDVNKDGVIGSGTDDAAGSAAASEISSTMTYAPANPIQIGSFRFYIYFGSVAGTSGSRNVIVLCNNDTCSGTFTKDETELLKAVDMGIDGIADAGLGQFRAATAIAGTPATKNNVTGATFTAPITNGATGTTAAWYQATPAYVAGVWAFDRPF